MDVSLCLLFSLLRDAALNVGVVVPMSHTTISCHCDCLYRHVMEHLHLSVSNEISVHFLSASLCAAAL